MPAISQRLEDYGDLRIGPLALLCRAAAGMPAPLVPKAYTPFFHSASRSPIAKPKPLFSLKLALYPKKIALPGRQPSFEASGHWRFYADNGLLWFATGYGDRETPCRICRVTENLSRGALFVDPDILSNASLSGRSAFPLSYPIDQFLVWGILARIGGVLLHAALTVGPDGNGVLFAGRSGAGKTTISNLCASAGWTVLSDDRALVYVQDGRVMASGTPWHGTGGHSSACTVPLTSIHFLEKSATTRTEKLDRYSLLEEFLLIAAIPWFLEGWATPTLATVNRIMDIVPPRRLHFRPEASALSRIGTA